MNKKLYTIVNGAMVENELTPALTKALNAVAVATYDMNNRPVYVFDNTGKAYYVATLWDSNRRRCSYDNGKTAYPSVNTLAGSCAACYAGSLPAVIRALFPDIKGTCPETCPGCYALPITRNFIPAITTILNTLETEQDPARFYALVERELYSGEFVLATAPDCVRIHDSGEFRLESDFQACVAFAARHPETDFYGYSKSEIVAAAFLAGDFPANFHCACSPWVTSDGVVLCAPVSDMYQFIYDDGTNPDLDTLVHCPAVNVYGERTGVTCKACGLCRRAKDGTKTAVYSHGNGAPKAAENIAARRGLVRGVVLTLETVINHRATAKAARRAKLAAKKARKAAKQAAAT